MHFRFSNWDDALQQAKSLEDFVKLFMRLLNKTAGDPNQALELLQMLGERYGLFTDDLTFEDVKNELLERGLIREKGGRGRRGRQDSRKGERGRAEEGYELTHRGEKALQRDSFDEIFTALRRDSGGGDHNTPYIAESGGDVLPELRDYRWGDNLNDVNFQQSIRNAIVSSGMEQFQMREEDLAVHNRELQTSCATVLAIDISHSMILYGEDRITPARSIAMALAEYIQTEFPKDSLDVILFGDEASVVPLKELPYIDCGPYHTNTKAGIDLAHQILRTKKQANKQIILITDGKPSAIHERGEIYKNPFGLDPVIVNQTINSAVECRRHNIVITTFMITSDHWLRQFVEELTEANQGRAYYSTLDKLGSFVFEDYVRNKKKRI
jgi:uncharacterized protein with von Willebrand factor type A (vWA) domain